MDALGSTGSTGTAAHSSHETGVLVIQLQQIPKLTTVLVCGTMRRCQSRCGPWCTSLSL